MQPMQSHYGQPSVIRFQFRFALPAPHGDGDFITALSSGECCHGDECHVSSAHLPVLCAMLTGMRVIPRRGFLFAGAAACISRLAAQTASRESLIDDVVTANHILAAQEIVDAFGHVSVRSAPGAGRYWISRSVAPAQVTA